MQTSVLGKRSQSYFESPFCTSETITPESSPYSKRLKSFPTIIDVHSDCNKENVPPRTNSPPPTPMRRASTDVIPIYELRTPRRHSAEYPTTPATSLAHLSLATPPPTPCSLLPIHARVRALLRPTANGATPMSGRLSERSVIMEFLSQFADSDEVPAGASSLYISGSPGTGKTALANSIIGEVTSSITVININCMALNSMETLWERISDELLPVSLKRSKAGSKTKDVRSVDKLLANVPKCVLVLDELDHIAACPQSLNSIFSLAQTHSPRLRIIGIANTHTLTSSPSQLVHVGVHYVKTIHFSPYSAEELLEILKTRLSSLFNDPVIEKSAKNFLPTPTLTLLTKKIASLTGDVRALFEVLRGAIDISMSSSQSKSNSLDCMFSVTPANILSALKAYAPASSTGSGSKTPAAGSNEVVAKIRNLGLHARFVLLSLTLACKRLDSKLPTIGSSNASSSFTRSPSKRVASVSRGSALVDTSQLNVYYTNLLKGSDLFTPVSRSEFGDIVNMLETLGLVAMMSSSVSPTRNVRKSFGRSSSFVGSGKSATSASIAFADGVRMDEVTRGLGLEQATGSNTNLDPKEEELHIIWNKEMREIRRLISTNSCSKDGASRGFEDMAED